MACTCTAAENILTKVQWFQNNPPRLEDPLFLPCGDCRQALATEEQNRPGETYLPVLEVRPV